MKKTKRKTSPRKPPVYDHVKFRAHIVQVGEIIYLWNRVHDNLFQIFWGIVGPADHTLAFELWHVIQSDSAQREMVQKTAIVRLKGRMLADALWVCRAHEKLRPSYSRNCEVIWRLSKTFLTMFG
jgi:hypothetical protein